MGLAQRGIEQAGFSTISLSNIPDLTGSVSVPRMVAIDHPFGRTVGAPDDRETQMTVLRFLLRAVEEMDAPGSVRYLPIKWEEDTHKGKRERLAPPPIAIYLRHHPWQVPRLISRDIPHGS